LHADVLLDRPVTGLLGAPLAAVAGFLGGAWDDAEPDDRFHVLPEAAVRPSPFLTAPETHPVLKADVHDYSALGERYDAFAAALRVDGGDTNPALRRLHLLSRRGILRTAGYGLRHPARGAGTRVEALI
jgi:hypothetical protein